MRLKTLLPTSIAAIITLCSTLSAQTNANIAPPAAAQANTDAQATPAGQTTANPQTPSAAESSTNTAAALNATQFPNNRIAPAPEVVPPAVETPLLWSGYETHFAVDFGGRTLALTGNGDVYRTYVNLQSGVRLLDQSFEMHSVEHNGSLFDDLNESSFGLGGDPNEVFQLRASKNRWYDFWGSWRRDINFWDYNLLANPYNTPTSTLFIPINVSPALLDLSRKMLDVNLTLLPQSSVQFVLGYSHYRNNGFSYNTVHEGTEAELSQPWNNVSDTYHFGFSWRPAERTRISYDQFYTHEKNETNSILDFFPNQLSNGTPVNLGVTFAGTTPCAAPFVGSFVNPTCNLYTSYSNLAPYSTDIPTEQLAFETTYWRRLHVAGRGTYTGADTYMPYSNETFNGIDTTGAERQSVLTGRAKIQEITTTTDFGVTYDVTERLSIDDQFRWYAYRIPSAGSFLQTYLFGANALLTPNTFPSAACPPPYTGPGCPQHVAGSPADQSTTNYSMFQSHDQKRNTFQVNYDLGAHVTAYIGYEFERQRFVVDGTTASLSSFFPTLPNRGGCTARPVNGVCQNATTSISTASVQINTHGGIFGIAAEPIHKLRLNGDVLIDYSDNVFTNIMPRHMQLYRVKAIYTPKTWLDVHATFRDQEMRNLAAGLGNLQHNRNFSVGTVVSISPRWGIDLNYSYNNLLTNLNICFNETPTPPFASVTSICPVGYLTALSYYRNIDNFGSGNVMLKPFARTTVTAGYTITSTTGNNLLINPSAPLGPAAINYHLPDAAVALDVAKHVTLKAGWNLYDYIEKSAPLRIAPRNFRANLVTISLRYAM